ncbi:GNAT family N-acetyltransferase [Staphylococcus canis]|uniref:GCN5-related N-acetyltransferase n=1 Tax=Staphylococcus canis TaxID=2724942 RepID=A0ABS0T9H3_9STAP|nr:GNAT family N-acetyltransferase [Staphylococcus canis]MBI5975384.1 GNAT family N-acetyltransferase [Staphylococcus canis]
MFKTGQDENIYKDALYVREKVFVDEQGVSQEDEIDQFEHTAQYIVGYDNNHQPIATARYRIVDGIVKVERVAVLSSMRGQNIGQALMNTLEADALQNGYHHFKLGAQIHAIPFYEKLGYYKYGDLFMDAGIEHYNMEKIINSDNS